MIYTWLKNNETPQGFFEDEQSLLISYDMMPLRGLDACRQALNEKGRIAQGNLIASEAGTIYVVFRNDTPDIKAIDYGCYASFDSSLNSAYDLCLRSLCQYVSFYAFEPHKNKFGISTGENETLRAFHWRSLQRDKRRRLPLKWLKPAVEEILGRLGFAVKLVEFVEG